MTVHIRLYIGDDRDLARAAEQALRAVLPDRTADDFELTVIDVRDDPEAAEADGIIATPTAVRVDPGPSRRLIGDLSDRGRLAAFVDEDATSRRSTPDPDG